MRKVRVGLIADQLELGGQELAMLEVVRRLARSRFAPYLYAFRPGSLLPDARALGVPLLVGHDRPGHDERWTKADDAAKVAYRRRLAEALRADRIDVCLVYAWADGVRAAREAGVPAVVERVGGPALAARLRDKSGCDRIICESAAIRRLLVAQRGLLRCDPRRIVVIRNAVDTTRFDPARYARDRCRAALDLRAGDFAVGAVGRLAPVKNLDHLLEAIRLFVGRDPRGRRLRLVIVGPDRGVEGPLRARARALGISRQVRFVGSRRDIPPVLRALDAYAIPSLHEGVPFALLEAMAMGLPVIATQSPSVAETVAGNGYLVNALDPHQTFAALRELVGHPELRRTLGRRSRQLALRRSVDDMARRYERVLLDAVAEGRRRRRWRRRVVVVSDRAARGRDASLPALLRVHRALAVGGADVYLIAGHPAAPPSLPGWPPGRRLSVPATARGMPMAELGRLVEWIGPDLAMAASPRIVIRLRRLLRGDEIAFVPDAPRLRAGVARAVELADRVLFSRAAMRAAWARRLPRSSWKFQALSLSSGAGIALRRLVLFLSSGRPAPPVGPTSAARKTARPPARPRRR